MKKEELKLGSQCCHFKDLTKDTQYKPEYFSLVPQSK